MHQASPPTKLVIASLACVQCMAMQHRKCHSQILSMDMFIACLEPGVDVCIVQYLHAAYSTSSVCRNLQSLV